MEAHFLQSSSEITFDILISSSHSFTKARVTGDAELMPEEPDFSEEPTMIAGGAEAMFDEGHSLDLSPIKIAHDETLQVPEDLGGGNTSSGSGLSLDNELVDDTFHYRRHVRAAG